MWVIKSESLAIHQWHFSNTHILKYINISTGLWDITDSATVSFLRKQSQVTVRGFSSYTRKPSNSPRWIRSLAALCLISPSERHNSVSNIALRNPFRDLVWKSPGHPISSCLSELAAPLPQTSWGKNAWPQNSSELTPLPAMPAQPYGLWCTKEPAVLKWKIRIF